MQIINIFLMCLMVVIVGFIIIHAFVRFIQSDDPDHEKDN